MNGGQNGYVDPWSIIRDLSERSGSAVEVRRPKYSIMEGCNLTKHDVKCEKACRFVC
jgi:hypothetical protein